MSGNMIVFNGICENISNILHEINIPEEKYDAICRYLAIISTIFESTQQKTETKSVKIRRKRRTKEEINAEKTKDTRIGQNLSRQSE